MRRNRIIRRWVSLGVLVAFAVVSGWMAQAAEEKKSRELKPDPALVAELTKPEVVAELKAKGEDIVSRLNALKPITAVTPIPPCKQADNCYSPEKVKLGAMLFFDTRLSGDASTPCVKCHHPTMGWGESSEISVGYPGSVHFRNSHSALNNARMFKFFWDGRTLSLESQASAAAGGGSANNWGIESMVQARLMQVPEYRKMFMEIFGQIPNQDAIERAIATFERYELNTKPEGYPFGRYMLGDDKALTPQQIKGMQLFAGKARCILCHNGEIFTDEDHHNTGVPRPEAFATDPLRQIELRQRMRGAGIPNFIEVDDELGLYMRTHRTPDKHKLRTQPLLEWKATAPLMHNGMFFTMEEVVDFYNAGGGEDRYHNKSPLLKPLNLTDQEKADLVAFLDSLNSEEVPGVKEFGNPKLPGYGSTSTIAGIN